MCTCTKPQALLKALIKLTRYQMYEIRPDGSDDPHFRPAEDGVTIRTKLGEYYAAFIGDEIIDKRVIMIIIGVQYSGKTTIVRPAILILPPELRSSAVFTPTYKSNFAWHGFSPDVTKIVDMNDFRADGMVRLIFAPSRR